MNVGVSQVLKIVAVAYRLLIRDLDRHCCLDSNANEHHDADMRTTVTLDMDAEQLLRLAMHQRRKSFKETLNDAIRTGLGAKPLPKNRPRFAIKARPMGLRPGIDPTGLNKLADDLEVDGIVGKGRYR